MSPKQVWLRKWELASYLPVANVQVKKLSLSSSGETALKMRFDIFQSGIQSDFWYADMELFNVNKETTDELLTKDMLVSVSAGFENGPFDQIFIGPVYQTYWERPNGVDYRLTLHCVLGLDVIVNNPINKSQGPNADQRSIIRHIADWAMTPVPINAISTQLDPQRVRLPRGATYFGTPDKYFTQIAGDNSMQYFFDNDGVTIGYMSKPDSDPTHDPNAEAATALEYTPTQIIGTPQQTEFGVSFRVMLDARVSVDWPPMRVRIKNSAVRLIRQQIGVTLPSLLAADGEYNVLSVRHIGDTRGEEWFTEIEATVYTIDEILNGMQATG